MDSQCRKGMLRQGTAWFAQTDITYFLNFVLGSSRTHLYLAPTAHLYLLPTAHLPERVHVSPRDKVADGDVADGSGEEQHGLDGGEAQGALVVVEDIGEVRVRRTRHGHVRTTEALDDGADVEIGHRRLAVDDDDVDDALERAADTRQQQAELPADDVRVGAHEQGGDKRRHVLRQVEVAEETRRVLLDLVVDQVDGTLAGDVGPTGCGAALR